MKTSKYETYIRVGTHIYKVYHTWKTQQYIHDKICKRYFLRRMFHRAGLYRIAWKETRKKAILRKSFLTGLMPHALHIFPESVRIGHNYTSIKHLAYGHMNHAGRSGFSRIISFPSYAVQTNIGNFRPGRQDVTGYNDNGRPFLLCDPRVPKIQCFSFTSRIYDISLSLIWNCIRRTAWKEQHGKRPETLSGLFS